MNDYKMYDVTFPYTVKFVLEDEHTEVTIKTKSREKYFDSSVEGVTKQKQISDKYSNGAWAKYMVNHLREKMYDLDIDDVVVDFGTDYDIKEMTDAEIKRFQRNLVDCND